MSLTIQEFYDLPTGTLTYVVHKNSTAVIIDPVWNFDSASATLSGDQMREINLYLEEHKLVPGFVFETHVHADHISSSAQLKKTHPNLKVGIHKNICEVQKTFSGIFRLADFAADGSQFDLLFEDGQKIDCGEFQIEFLHTPGHTPACASLKIEDSLFTGDALFMPDFGTGRCDFPGGDASTLFESVQKIYSLDDNTQIFVGHDYCPGDRKLSFRTTVWDSKNNNVHISSNTTKEQFVKFRTERDTTLDAPKLLLPSLQINMNAGEPLLWDDEPTLKIPLTIKTR